MSSKALPLIQEAIRMMSGGMYVSSYESQIIEKLREAEAALVGFETVDVRFEVSRRDLVELLGNGGAYEGIDYDVAERPTEQLLIAILQEALYDHENGPQLEGNFRLIEGSKQ